MCPTLNLNMEDYKIWSGTWFSWCMIVVCGQELILGALWLSPECLQSPWKSAENSCHNSYTENHSAMECVNFMHWVKSAYCILFTLNCLLFSKHWPSGPMLSISWNLVCVSVCLSLHLFIFEVPFKRNFAPTAQCWMSKNFWDSDSLGKTNGKKWCQIG